MRRRSFAGIAGVGALALLARTAEASPVELGARVASQSIYLEGDSTPADLNGVSFGGDVAVRVDPRLAILAGYQHVIYDSRSDRLAQGSLATGDAIFAGVRLSSAPDADLAVLLELGVGYRWLRVPFDSGAPRSPAGEDRFDGLEPLRVHVGPTIALPDHLHLDLLLGAALGRFHGTTHPQTCAITGACTDSLFDSDTSSKTHVLLELVAALRWG